MFSIFMYDIQDGKQLWKNDELFRPEAPAQKGILGKLQALGQQLGISKKPSRNSDFDVFIAEQFVKSDLVSKDRVLKLP